MPRPPGPKTVDRPTVPQLLRILFPLAKPTRVTEEVRLLDSLGRTSAARILSHLDLPRFDRAAMDGFAVRSTDTKGAMNAHPTRLSLIGSAEAGANPASLPTVSTGEAVKILTGAPLPRGANSVAMLENCRSEGRAVAVLRESTPFENVSRRGEDYPRGSTVVEESAVIRPWHIAALAALGMAKVQVVKQLRVGVLSTGSELVEVGQLLSEGNVVNSTKPMVLSMIKEARCHPVDLGTVPDDVESIREKLSSGLDGCDLLVSTGGSSVGEKDLVQRAVLSIGGSRIIANGVKTRPGSATGVAAVAGKVVFMLSGLPVAAYAGFVCLVRPVLRHMMGVAETLQPNLVGRLSESVPNRPGFRSIIRVRLKAKRGELLVEPITGKGSGLVSTLTNADGILLLDEPTAGRRKGDLVKVELI